MGGADAGRRVLEGALYAGALGVRELFRSLPPDRAVARGAGIGRAWSRLRGPRTEDARVNLRLAFPDWSEDERDGVLGACFENLGRHLAEVCVMQGRHREALLAAVDVEGHSNYEEARRRGASRGLIALTAHFGSWEVCAATMAERGYPLSVVGHLVSNPRIQSLVSGWRERAGIREIALGRASAGVFSALGRGDAVAMLLDQSAHESEGVFAPFFGIPALTRSGPAYLAMARGIVVLPVFIYRQGDAARHVVRFEAPLEMEPTGDDPDAALVRNVTRMNAAIEAAVRERPDHWLWPHRRFKRRPLGEPALYPRRRSRGR